MIKHSKKELENIEIMQTETIDQLKKRNKNLHSLHLKNQIRFQ